MKVRVLAAAAVVTALTASTAAAADAPRTTGGPDVAYTVMFLKDGELLAAPTVVGRFGRDVRVELPNLMRAEVVTQAPDAKARSLTSARLSVFRDGVWQAPKVMTMQATLTMTPSFEYSVEGTPYRFVVMPRRILPAAGEGAP